MRSVIVAMGIGVSLALAGIAGAQTPLEWLSRAYRPLKPRVGLVTPLQPRTAATPAVVVKPAPMPSREAIAAALRKLGHPVPLPGDGHAAYDVRAGKLAAQGTVGSAGLMLAGFELVSQSVLLPGASGQFRVSVTTTHVKAVQAVACDFRYDGQLTPPAIPGSVTLQVYGSGGVATTSEVPTEVMSPRLYRVSYSQIFGASDWVDVTFAAAPAVAPFLLEGCHVDVFPL